MGVGVGEGLVDGGASFASTATATATATAGLGVPGGADRVRSRSPSPVGRRRSQSPVQVTPGMAAERREGRLNAGVRPLQSPGGAYRGRGSKFDDRDFSVVGLDDDEARSALDHSLLKQWQEDDAFFAGGGGADVLGEVVGAPARGRAGSSVGGRAAGRGRAQARFGAREAMRGKWLGRHAFNACGETGRIGGVKVTALLAAAADGANPEALRNLLERSVDGAADAARAATEAAAAEADVQGQGRASSPASRAGKAARPAAEVLAEHVAASVRDAVTLPEAGCSVRRSRARWVTRRDPRRGSDVRASLAWGPLEVGAVMDDAGDRPGPIGAVAAVNWRDESRLDAAWHGRPEPSRRRSLVEEQEAEERRAAVARAKAEEASQLRKKGNLREGISATSPEVYTSGKALRFSDLEAEGRASDGALRRARWCEADRGLYMDEHIRARAALRDAPVVETAVRVFFWSVVAHARPEEGLEGGPLDASLGARHRLSRADYEDFAAAAFQSLLSAPTTTSDVLASSSPRAWQSSWQSHDHDWREAAALAWRCDRGASPDSMSLARFHDALFDLADAWVIGDNPMDYAGFIEVLMAATFDADFGFLDYPYPFPVHADADTDADDSSRATSATPTPAASRASSFAHRTGGDSGGLDAVAAPDLAGALRKPFVEVSHVGTLRPARHDRFAPRMQHTASGGFALMRAAMQHKADSVMSPRHAAPGGGLFLGTAQRPSTVGALQQRLQ